MRRSKPPAPIPRGARAASTSSTRMVSKSRSPRSTAKTRSSEREGETAMEGFVADKLAQFDSGKISRRRLIEALTLAATATATTAKSAEQVGVKAAAVNHVSYTCPNFRQAADWYSKACKLDQVGGKGAEATLPFGKKGEPPYASAAEN